MAPRQYADLHCHNTFYGFNRMRNSAAEHNPEVFHPWTVLPSKLKDMERGSNANTYSQSNMAQITLGRVRLAFLSITPVERGFFEWHDEASAPSLRRQLVRWATGIAPLKTAIGLARAQGFDALDEVGKLLRRGPLREAFQLVYLRFGRDRMRYLTSQEYDYWDEFMREYRFLEADHGAMHTTTLDHASRSGWVTEEVTGRYELVNDADRLTGLLTDEQSEDVAVVLTIEGAHVLSMGPDSERLPDDVIMTNIDKMKALDYPIFFITFAHHFDNGLCGHAPSIPDVGGLVIDQSRRLNEGFEEERDIGRRVVRELLDITEELEDRGGKRVLLDVKHMSARTRQQYYAEFIEPYNEAWEERSAEEQARYPRLPVIGSHICYSGVATLEELEAHTDRENDHWHIGPYNAWSINFSDEDVRAVFHSDGLMGICFDQRIAGITLRQRVPHEHWAHVVANQIFGLVDVIMTDDRIAPEDKPKIWDTIMMGTDYDGVINPLTKYPTALSMPEVFDDLERVLRRNMHTRMIAQIGVEELLEKIAWKNAHAFVQRHMPAAMGRGQEGEAAAE